MQFDSLSPTEGSTTRSSSKIIFTGTKQEYKCHSISFDEFFEKMCNQVLDPFIFNTKFLSNKLLKNYKNICFI